ncbi:hypothetical protein HPB47_028296 [Ixodes persulcatus]|uniref:Uncharacterized protein n=1 Tax=Ixodes persulcatus TaxID=34615 RepID=A0AC60PTT8_IXOPE|nr:hypothetical protein HPB47_028296 [Ixodes persulcatus]
MALIVVPGWVPLCLRCNRTGHVRKECRAPRCSVCRRFGHQSAECVWTYALATAPVCNDKKIELLMDKVEAEEVARVLKNVSASPAETTTGVPGGTAASSLDVKAPKADEVQAAEVRDPPPAETPAPSTTKTKVHNNVPEEDEEDAPMGDAKVLAGGPASKKCRDDASADSAVEGREEPPSKAAPGQRLSGKKTNILKGYKKEANLPP